MTNYRENERLDAFNKTLSDKKLDLLSPTYTNARTKYTFKCNTCGDIFTKVAQSITSQDNPCPSCNKEYRASKAREAFVGKYDATMESSGLSEMYIVTRYPEYRVDNADFIHKVCGNTISTSLGNLRRAQKHGTTGCKYCESTHTYTEDEIKSYFKKERPMYTYHRSYMTDTHHLHVVFTHDKCGNERDLRYNVVLRGNGCRFCSESGGEETIAYTLDSNGVTYKQEWVFDGLTNAKGNAKRVDFYLEELNMVIEYDGLQHYEAIPTWGGEEYLKHNQDSDERVNKYMELHGITLIRIPYTLVGHSLQKEVERIITSQT